MSQKVPIDLMDGPIAVLEGPSRFVPAQQDASELGHIASYYAAESLWSWVTDCRRSDADATPSFGEDNLE